MREHHGLDVREREAELREVVIEMPREAREPSVDSAQLPSVLDQIPVHLVGPKAVDPRGDFPKLHTSEYRKPLIDSAGPFRNLSRAVSEYFAGHFGISGRPKWN